MTTLFIVFSVLKELKWCQFAADGGEQAVSIRGKGYPARHFRKFLSVRLQPKNGRELIGQHLLCKSALLPSDPS